MARTPRKADILIVLGLLVVIAWAPAYVAQGPHGQALADGASFTLPAPRDGDHAVLGLVLHVEGDDVAYQSGPLVDVRFRAPTDEEAELGAAVVQEQTVRPAHVALGPAIVVEDAREETYLYGPDGRHLFARSISYAVVTPETRGRDHGGMVGDTVEETHDRAWFRPIYERWDDDAEHVVYRPGTPLEQIASRVWFSEADDHAVSDDEPTPAMAGVAVEHGDDGTAHLAATAGGPALFARDVITQPVPREGKEIDGIGFGTLSYHVDARWDAPFRIEGTITDWRWYTQDFPTTVGRHRSVALDDGRAVTLDMVPLRIEKGDGPVLTEQTLRVPEADARGAPDRVVFPELQLDPTPLVDGVSLADLTAHLASSEVPGQTADVLAAEGWIGSAAFLNGTWVVAVVAADGSAGVVTIPAQHGVLGAPRDACDETLASTLWVSRIELRADCDDLDPQDTDPQRRVVPPAAMMGRFADLAEPEGPAIFMLRPELQHRVRIADGQGWTRHEPIRLASYHLGTAHSDEDLYVVWTTDASGEHLRAVDASDGRIVVDASQRKIDGDASHGVTKPVRIAATGAPIETLEPLSAHAGIAGLIVVALGLITRLWASFKTSGLALGAALYARIHKDVALDHTLRERIHDTIHHQPGIPLAELADLLEVSRTGAFHHAETLVRNGLAARVRLAGALHYTPPELGTRARVLASARQHPHWDRVLSIVEDTPGIPLGRLADRLGRSRSSVSRIGRRMVDAGVLERVRDGRVVRYRPVGSDAS